MIVLDEEQTLSAAQAGHSIARFGDGELRIAVDGSCSSQCGDTKMAKELRNILAGNSRAIACVPDFVRSPRQDVWAKYAGPPFSKLYTATGPYGSSFITRPDNAPWIDTPEYWAKVRQLWEGKKITMVCGTDKDIGWIHSSLVGAKDIAVVQGPSRDAYGFVDAIEEQIGTPRGTVLMCLGATATVLAARLADKGVHALDLGHIWHFMNHAGSFAFAPKDLRSKDYANQLHSKHSQMKWGRSGASHAPEVIAFAMELKARSVLDYGCGRATLKDAIPILKVNEYDPGIRGKDHLPKPADLIVCTDVLEHVEEDKIDNVLKHQYSLAAKGAYFVIALTPARELLPDGRNAHILLRDAQWWLDSLKEVGWKIEHSEKRKGLAVWCRK